MVSPFIFILNLRLFQYPFFHLRMFCFHPVPFLFLLRKNRHLFIFLTGFYLSESRLSADIVQNTTDSPRSPMQIRGGTTPPSRSIWRSRNTGNKNAMRFLSPSSSHSPFFAARPFSRSFFLHSVLFYCSFIPKRRNGRMVPGVADSLRIHHAMPPRPFQTAQRGCDVVGMLPVPDAFFQRYRYMAYSAIRISSTCAR